jgi:hypothetical protein
MKKRMPAKAASAARGNPRRIGKAVKLRSSPVVEAV